ncbi:hypothetical protein [Sciscionella sediminilitoris]|uniref:hypothetical protein n=1 Tax=Sciscionella sediminilitoris TaxID=1445613 RepID=UPI0012E16203|nr:hypothetical protein [Sciscionella sp. SE31]
MIRLVRIPEPPDVHAERRRWAYAEAMRGALPAEALDRKDGERLLAELWHAGWTDTEIAVHTKWSTYTVGRIRDRLGLATHSTNHTRKVS